MTQLDLDSYKTKKDTIKHEGIISKISKNTITISLKGNVNCEGCKAQSACGVSDSNDKEIEIENPTQSFQLNETVDLVLNRELGLKAVFWAYVFPFILMFLVLILTSLFLKEWLAGLVSLFVLVPYYFMLFVLKDTFKKAFQLSILKFN
ncbi:positive regulator of sigma(E), RseC/MucC [Lutibacter agarilyticus]|uniref:Positive regulator of sigma(E), RseC/MucC n=1 Tax=Lutibacter agarilyticus TaxID=1109740 RepID=A0A238WCF8_9FLAO|nr:SoxR reducing system RseC family protein [Lutibacter agarilyticus]SNR43933.1 positive regulator of sigma(E), RseC/MucC [Lutibacter agarilyticus]